MAKGVAVLLLVALGFFLGGRELGLFDLAPSSQEPARAKGVDRAYERLVDRGRWIRAVTPICRSAVAGKPGRQAVRSTGASRLSRRGGV
jgi:hypothetical protein